MHGSKGSCFAGNGEGRGEARRIEGELRRMRVRGWEHFACNTAGVGGAGTHCSWLSVP